MLSACLAFVLAAPVERLWLDRLDAAAIPAVERFAGHPPELVGILGTHRGRHWGSANAAAVSPDGKLIASGGSDRVVRLWEARDLTPVTVLEGHRDNVARVLFSPDGQLLATACDSGSTGGPVDRTVRLWRVAGKNTKLWATIPEQSTRIVGLAFLDGGQRIGTVAMDGAVRVWELRDKEPVQRVAFTILPENQMQTFFLVGVAVFAPDGKTVIAGGPFQAVMTEWELATGARRGTLSEKEERSRLAAATASPDGSMRVREADGKTDVLRKDQVIARLVDVRVTPGGWSADGKVLTGTTNSRVRVWDVAADGLRERVLDNAATNFLYGAAFSPTGDKLVGVHSGPTMGEDVFLTWEFRGVRPTPKAVPRGEPRGWSKVVFGPGGALAAVDARPGGAVFDVATGKLKVHLPAPPKNPYHVMIHALAFSPDGKRLATAVSASRFEGKDIVLDWHAIVWDISAANAVSVCELPSGGPKATAFAFTADGKGLLAGHGDGSLAWWDITETPPRLVKTWKPHDRPVSAVAVTANGKEFASGTDWGELRRGQVGEVGGVVVGLASPMARTDQVSFTPDGTQLLAMFNTGRFVAANPTGKVVIDLTPGNGLFPSGARRGFGLAADGRHVAVPTVNGLVYILRLRL